MNVRRTARSDAVIGRHEAESTLEGRVDTHEVVAQAAPGRYLRADSRGRWCHAHLGGRVVRRTLDGRVVQRRGSVAVTLPADEARRVHAAIPSLALELAELTASLPADAVQLARGDRGAFVRALDTVARWDPDDLDAEVARFDAVYPQRVAVLPPDRYRDVVVQPATGCPNGECSFCTLYDGPAFQPLALDAFGVHLEGVAELLGPLLPGRDGVFLGSASALSLPDRTLRPVLERVEEAFGRRKRGVASFLDPDRAPRRAGAAWSHLEDQGLRLAVLGLETGAPELRAELGKSPDLTVFEQTARALAEGGVNRGVTVLAGPGGEAWTARHRDETCAFIERLQLRRGDRVYVSPLRGSLPADRLAEEAQRLREAVDATTGAQVVPYSLGRFHYYA